MPTEELIVRKLVDGEWATVVDEQTTNGGGAGAPVVRGPFEFAFDTPGLTNGVTFYTPTVGDLILGAIIAYPAPWNGTTPTADIGPFVDLTSGWFDQTAVGAIGLGGGLAPFDSFLLGSPGFGEYGQIAIVTGAVPIKIVVSQNGEKGGADPGSTSGTGSVYLVTATPVAF